MENDHYLIYVVGCTYANLSTTQSSKKLNNNDDI